MTRYVARHATYKLSSEPSHLPQSKVTALCNEKSTWLDSNPDSSLPSIQEQKRDFDHRLQPYLAKLAPPES